MSRSHQPNFLLLMRSFLIIICLLVCSCSVLAQKHDNYWLFGYTGWEQGPVGDSIGLTGMYFDTNYQPVFVNREDLFINFLTSKSFICDSMGNIQVSCNADNIYNNFNEVVENGNNLTEDNCFTGCNYLQGTIILPYPSTNNKYWIFSTQKGFATPPNAWLIYTHLFASLVDMAGNNGHGEVIERKKMILMDTLAANKITAVKHANGRDWWVLGLRDVSNQYFRFLVDPTGIHNMGKISAGINEGLSLGNAIFSPDGTKYARLDDTWVHIPAHLSVFEFDRCSGYLIHLGTDTLPQPSFGGGIAFSHDSRYLWMSKVDGLYQYDLHDPDFLNTSVFVPHPTPSTSTDLHIAQLGPDGRIYINKGRSTMSLPCINYPHRPTDHADYNMSGYQLLTYSDFTMPNQPWFRLGPVDGSACDTLGLDNHPLCAWRYELEDSTAQTLSVTFTDLSTYQPDTWLWYFGDGATSTERYPQHTYDSAGIYTACLVVSNAYSSDTMCQMINLGMVSSAWGAIDEVTKGILSLQPNPASTQVQVNLTLPDGFEGQLQVMDVLGRTYTTQSVQAQQQIAISTAYWQRGVYICLLKDREGRVQDMARLLIH
jgi:PKD domain/Secretion system C-terminal sorting domain